MTCLTEHGALHKTVSNEVIRMSYLSEQDRHWDVCQYIYSISIALALTHDSPVESKEKLHILHLEANRAEDA